MLLEVYYGVLYVPVTDILTHTCLQKLTQVKDHMLSKLIIGYELLDLILGPKLLLDMGCVKLGEQICVYLPSVGEQTAN